MRRILTEFLQEARSAGLPISVAESIDALRAAAAVGLERRELREALAAAVVKDEADRPIFDEVFDRYFSAAAEEARRRRRRAPAVGESGFGGSGGKGEASRASRREQTEPSEPTSRSLAPRESKRASAVSRRVEPRDRGGQKRLRRRELLRKPFREMDPLEAEELATLADELARRFRGKLRRRLRFGRRGRLDFRRTLRRSVPHGGVPFDLTLRRRRPGRPYLLALCDVSGSVKLAADFFASLLSPCEDFFRSVRIFVYVDRPVEASVEKGRLVPHGSVDFHAFSDFGRALAELSEREDLPLGRSTVVVILGDARNNRRPARADLLKRLRSRVRVIWWLNPERKERWGTGDSAIESYRPVCDELLECATGAELLAALARVTR